MAPIFMRGLASRKKPSGDVVVPRLEADIIGVRASSLRLASYRRICEFRASETLPVTYPQILAAPHPERYARPEDGKKVSGRLAGQATRMPHHRS